MKRTGPLPAPSNGPCRRCDDLAFQLEGLDRMRVKDNAYLIGQRDAAIAALERIERAMKQEEWGDDFEAEVAAAVTEWRDNECL